MATYARTTMTDAQITVTLIGTDGVSTDFQANHVRTVNDVAFVDGIVHTDVADVEVSA